MAPPSTYLPTVLMHTTQNEPVRGMIDSGAELSMIFKSKADQLDGHRFPADVTMVAVGRSAFLQVNQAIRIHVRTLQGWVYPLVLYIVDQPSMSLPVRRFEPYRLYPTAERYYQGLPMADTYGLNQTQKVHVILGQDTQWGAIQQMWVSPDHKAAFHKTIWGVTFQGEVPPNPYQHPANNRPRQWPLQDRQHPPHPAANAVQVAAVATKIPQLTECDKRVIASNEDQQTSAENILLKLWHLDNMSLREEEKKQPLSVEQQKVMAHFHKHIHFRDGHYHILLQVRDDAPPLKDTRTKALNHFRYLEKCLQRDPELQNEYSSTMAKYLRDGHIFEVSKEELKEAHPWTEFFAPHRGVKKTSALSNKPPALRIVFNFSTKGGSAGDRGISLQDYLMQPTPTPINVVHVTLPFRLQPYAVSCDIKSMYYMIKVDREKDSPFLRFFYRFPKGHPLADPSDPEPKVFAFAALPFGLAASSSLACLTVQYHCDKYGDTHPEVVQLIKESAFVDDVNWSSSSKEECKATLWQMNTIFQEGGFTLAKYASSHPDLLEGLPADKLQFPEEKHGVTTILGHPWDTKADRLLFLRDPMDDFMSLTKVTKKALLSTIAQIYDPMVLLGPYMVTAKLLFHDVCMIHKEEMQDLKGVAKKRAMKASWTKEIPDHIAKAARVWISQVKDLQDMSIPRCLRDNKPVEKTMVVAAGDASEKCVGCAIYLHTKYTDGTTTSRLVLAKQRIAVAAATTLPRLELEAALLCAQAAAEVVKFLKLPHENVVLFSDSTISLCWIRADRPEIYNVYVHNRIVKIQALFNKLQWYHIEGTKNPADLLTRPGIAARDLATKYYEYWFSGGYNDSDPVRGCQPAPGSHVSLAEEVPDELKSKHVFSAAACQLREAKELLPADDVIEPLFQKHSDVQHILRVIVLVLRWKLKTKKGATFEKLQTAGHSLSERILTADLQAAYDVIFRANQVKHFRAEYFALSQGQEISKKSNLAPLRPFLDKNGVMRAKGRISSANLPQHVVNPAIIQPRDDVIKAMLRHWHNVNGHPSANVLLYQVRRQGVWPLRPKQICREITKGCITCMKIHAQPGSQAMAELPPERLDITKHPFAACIFDALGPIRTLPDEEGRDMQKSYIILMVCMVYRAAELILVPNLSTESIMTAIRKLAARYGPSRILRCDCFKSHLQVSKELEVTYSMWTHTVQGVVKQAERLGIEVQFSTPYAHHTQGAVERLVRTTKECLYKALGKKAMTFAQLDLATAEAMAVINRRPFSSAEVNNSDGTISHVLSPFELIYAYQPSDIHIKDEDEVPQTPDLVRIWKERAETIQHFKQAFVSQYLNTLLPVPTKGKWLQETHNLEPDDLVLVKSATKNKMLWPIYRVHKVLKGRDGLVRTVVVADQQMKLTTRPVTQIIKIARPKPPVPERNDSLPKATSEKAAEKL